jgi:hypothetical protein
MASRAGSTTSVSTASETGAGWIPGAVTAELLLWAALVLVTVLDVVTTGVGLQQGLDEGNPVMASAIEHAGLGGLAAAKTAILAFGAIARLCLPSYRLVIPFGLATPGAIAVLVNSMLLLQV